MEKTVIGSGIYMLDSIVVRDYPAWPSLRPFSERTVIEEVGGTCGNVMCILAWLGWKAMPEVSLDESPEGRKIASDLARYGCDLRHVTNTPGGGATILRCTHKRDAEGNHTIAFRATGSGGSRFPKRHFLRARDEAPAFLEALAETPAVFFFDDPADCMEKEGVDAGCPVDLVRQMTDSLRGHLLIGRANYPRGCPCPRGYLLPQKLRDRQDAVVGSCFDIFQELRAAPAVKFWGVQVEEARLERTDSFEETLLQSAADAHDFAGCFHLGGQGIVRVRKFVKGETGHLGDYVIQRGLKGGRRICQRDLVEGHADSYFGGDAGDRVAAGL